MDNLRDGINKIGKSLENKAEDALNRMEDELDNLQDEPVPVYSTGIVRILYDVNSIGSPRRRQNR